MLDQIFHDYCDKVIDGNESIKETYGTYTNTPTKWIQCEDITVKALVNRICDAFESSGYDLTEVPIYNIRDKFVDTPIRTQTPSEYISLNEAKSYVEEQLENFQSIEALQNHPNAEEMQKSLTSALESIISSMKELM